jgi:SAM-dependent methyltransferase
MRHASARAPGARLPRSASWYLDPIVARQKAEAFRLLIEQWRDRADGLTLKTDLFEEANGEDALAPHLSGGRRPHEATPGLVGLDLDLRTTVRAGQRFCNLRHKTLVADLRRLGLRDGAFDLVVSPSTLDHFENRGEIEQALDEIRRVLRPGGVAVVILDNPRNPLYHVLRWASPFMAPFRLGKTLGASALRSTLERRGFEVIGHDYAIHNPRGVSTLTHLALRAVLGRHAERPIRALLAAFAWLDRLPSRSITACFVAVGARRSMNGAVDARDGARSGAAR